jgi:hypothetical protein
MLKRKQYFENSKLKKAKYADFGELGTILDILSPTAYNIPEEIVRQKYPDLREYLTQIRIHNNGIKIYYDDISETDYFKYAIPFNKTDWKRPIKSIVKSDGFKEYYTWNRIEKKNILISEENYNSGQKRLFKWKPKEKRNYLIEEIDSNTNEISYFNSKEKKTYSKCGEITTYYKQDEFNNPRIFKVVQSNSTELFQGNCGYEIIKKMVVNDGEKIITVNYDKSGKKTKSVFGNIRTIFYDSNEFFRKVEWNDGEINYYKLKSDKSDSYKFKTLYPDKQTEFFNENSFLTKVIFPNKDEHLYSGDQKEILKEKFTASNGMIAQYRDNGCLKVIHSKVNKISSYYEGDVKGQEFLVKREIELKELQMCPATGLSGKEIISIYGFSIEQFKLYISILKNTHFIYHEAPKLESKYIYSEDDRFNNLGNVMIIEEYKGLKGKEVLYRMKTRFSDQPRLYPIIRENNFITHIFNSESKIIKSVITFNACETDKINHEIYYDSNQNINRIVDYEINKKGVHGIDIISHWKYNQDLNKYFKEKQMVFRDLDSFGKRYENITTVFNLDGSYCEEYDHQKQYYDTKGILYKTIFKNSEKIRHVKYKGEKFKEYKTEELIYDMNGKLIKTKIFKGAEKDKEKIHKEVFPDGTIVIHKNDGHQLYIKSTKNTEPERTECVICREKTANCVFNRCGHIVVCKECRIAMISSKETEYLDCPVCRKNGKLIETF